MSKADTMARLATHMKGKTPEELAAIVYAAYQSGKERGKQVAFPDACNHGYATCRRDLRCNWSN